MSGRSIDKRYSRDHEWVILDGDIATVGISDYAQEQLGGLVHIELPELEREVIEGESIGVAESAESVSEIYAPLAGKVVEINETIAEDPSIVNNDAEGEGWFFRLELEDPDAFDSLLDQDAYDDYLETL